MEMSGRNAQEIVPCHAHASPGDAAMPSGPSDHVRAQANFLEFPPLVQKILLCGPTTGRVAQSNVSPSMKTLHVWPDTDALSGGPICGHFAGLKPWVCHGSFLCRPK